MPADAPALAAEPDDPALVISAARGDTQAFAMLFQRHYPAIHAFAYRLSLCRAEAADIAQDTFVQAARALPSFREQASFKNWLYAIATNRSRDRYRQRVRRTRLDAAWATVAERGGSGADDSEGSLAHTEVREALAGLAPELREAVALVYFEGLHHGEAARVLGCAESTVSWRIFRAKRKLRLALRSGARPTGHA